MRLMLVSVLLAIFASAAVAGSAESPYNAGVEAWKVKNFAEARRLWARSLAEGGPDEALNNLGYLYYYGLGGETRHDKALELWRKGAALGVSESQFHLGNAYEKGGGVMVSLVQAYAWYRCAIVASARRSATDAVEHEIKALAEESFAKLTPKLSGKELADGERLATQYISKYATRLSIAKP
jgi:tetratricopeptide (TPR) repeat protein